MNNPNLLTPTVSNNAYRTSYGPTGSYAFPAGTNRLGIVVVLLTAASGSLTAPTVTLTGSVSGAWTLWKQSAQQVTSAHRETVCVFYKNDVGGTTETFTVDYGGDTFNEIFLAVLHEDSALIDRIGDGGSPHSNTITPQIPAPGLAEDSEVVLLAYTAQAGTATWPPDGTWTNLATFSDATRSRYGGLAYKVLGAGTAGTQPSQAIALSVTCYPAAEIAALRSYSSPPPVSTVAPALDNTTPAVGDTVTCDTGTWDNAPTSYTYQWQRSSDSGSTWHDISTVGLDSPDATSNAHTVALIDIGSELRCVVTAINSGGEASADSDASSEVAAPSTPSLRIVGLPVAQSDNTVHYLQTVGACLPGEKLIVLASTSINDIAGDAGQISDPVNGAWALDVDVGSADTSAHVIQSFSVDNAGRIDIDTTVEMDIKTGYHGQSPFWVMLALNAGDGSAFTFDGSATQFVATASPAPGPVDATSDTSYAFVLAVIGATDTKPWLTPGVGWTKLFDSYNADHTGSDSDGIAYGGETGYKIGVQYREISGATTGVTGPFTHDGNASTFVSSGIVVYGFNSAGGTTVTGAASLAVTEDATVAATAQKTGAANLAATADTAAAARLIAHGAASSILSLAVAAAATRQQHGAATLDLNAARTAAGSRTATSAATLNVTGTAAATAKRTATAAVSLPVHLEAAAATATFISAAASLAVSASLTAAGARTARGAAQADLVSTLAAAGSRTAVAAAALPVTFTATCSTATLISSAASLAATLTRAAAGVRAATGAAALPLSCTLAAAGSRQARTRLALDLDAAATVAATKVTYGQAARPITLTVHAVGANTSDAVAAVTTRTRTAGPGSGVTLTAVGSGATHSDLSGGS